MDAYQGSEKYDNECTAQHERTIHLQQSDLYGHLEHVGFAVEPQVVCKSSEVKRNWKRWRPYLGNCMREMHEDASALDLLISSMQSISSDPSNTPSHGRTETKLMVKLRIPLEKV
jgi:hypothetical protein